MDKIIKNVHLYIILIIASIFLYTYLFSFLPLNYFYIITATIETALLIVVFYKLISFYFVLFVYYMFNSQYKEYNKTIEKPRLFFHLIFIPIALIFYVNLIEKILIYNNLKEKSNNWHINSIFQNAELSIYLSCFTISILFVFFTRTKQFENHLIPIIEKKLNLDKTIIEFNPEANLKDLFEKELIGNNRCEITFENLELFASGKKMSEKAKWIDLKGQKSTRDATSKEISYGFIFDMLHENIIKDGIKNLSRKKRKAIMELIIDNFTKGDDIIKHSNLNKSYTNWKPFK